MADVLIRDVPDDLLDQIDAAALVAGLSRGEYLRLRLGGMVPAPDTSVTVADIDHFASHFADVGDDEVRRGAWR